MSIFDLGKDRKHPSLGTKEDQELVNGILNWSTGNCTKEELEKEHGKSFDWFGGEE